MLIKNGALAADLDPLGARIRKLRYKGLLVGKDGITVGRYANRIGGARFEIGGQSFQVAANENSNCLHGGPGGFDKKLWTLENAAENSACFSLLSPDGDQGFPGALSVRVRYTLSGGNKLEISYEACCDRDTVINLTNHCYFNLNGRGSARAHILQINACCITETDAQLIPTGKLLSVEGTRFDYRRARQFEPGHDENYVIDGPEGCVVSEGNSESCDALKGSLKEAARLTGLKSGIELAVLTDQPGVQLYNTKSRICLETQHFADSPNHPDFPTTLLKAGETFRSTTIYAFRDPKDAK